MAKNAEIIRSHIREILRGSQQPLAAYNQYLGTAREAKFEGIFELSLEELSQKNMVQTMVDIIKELKTCQLDAAQLSKVKKLESLLRIIKRYLSVKLKINSLDDFLKTKSAKKIEYFEMRGNNAKMWFLVDQLLKEAREYRSELKDTKQKLDDLKENWTQMGFHAGCSQSDLMANDIELNGLEKEYDRLTTLFCDKAIRYKTLLEERKEMSGVLQGMIMDSFDELADLKDAEKQLAHQELAKIERSWRLISDSSSY